MSTVRPSLLEATCWQMRVGIYTMNRPEAVECLYAIWSRRAVAVPLYDSLIPNAGAPITLVLCERARSRACYEIS